MFLSLRERNLVVFSSGLLPGEFLVSFFIVIVFRRLPVVWCVFVCVCVCVTGSLPSTHCDSGFPLNPTRSHG